MFGEISFIYQRTRTATVVSKNYCTLSSLEGKFFLDTLKVFPELIQSMKKDINKQYKDKILTYFCVTLYPLIFNVEHR